MTRSIRAVTALFGVTAILGACGSAGTSAPAAAAPVTIDIQGFKFPSTVDVPKGTKVTWSNKDGTKHTVTSGTPPTADGKFDGQVDAGGTFTFTFSDPGAFPYFCAIHNAMIATITVR